jgi:glycosyltransferase involved in cell wall biosynthesis
MGVPVVASTGGSLPEVLHDGALLPDPLDAEAIGRDLVRVLADRDLAGELVARGRRRAAELTWSACARATLEHWRRALAPGGG